MVSEFSVLDGDWKVWINTLHSAEHADIVLVVYGDAGCSGPIILGSAGNGAMFTSGNQDQFKINLGAVGAIYKIRLELMPTHKRKQPCWCVKDVRCKDMTTKETFKFKFNQYLSEQPEHGDLMRERAAIRPKQPVTPEVKYHIFVYTANQPGADTDANVYLRAYGERGDWGRRHLLKSNNENMFEEGQCDEFYLEAVSLGDIHKCFLAHDGSDPGEGWFCEKVIIREGENPTHEWVFICNRWLDTGCEDKAIETVLELEVYRPIGEPKEDEPEEELDDSDMVVTIKTRRESPSGPRPPIFLIIYGEDGHTDPIPLITEDKKTKLFQPGNVDEFKINPGKELGELYKIRIGHDSHEAKHAWNLEQVQMKDRNLDKIYTFDFNQWLGVGKGDSDTWREMAVEETKLPVVTYLVEVYTGTVRNADTDAKCYIHMFGSRGDAGKRALNKSQNHKRKFRKDQLDTFHLDAVSLDKIDKVILGHDAKERGAGWFVSKVIIKETEAAEEEEPRVFYFNCNRWLDSGQDDKKIERELFEKKPTPKEEKLTDWTLWVTTGTDMKMGTQAPVTITAYGDLDGDMVHTDPIPLKPKDKKTKIFKPGSTDEFAFDLGRDIGKLYKIRIGHDSLDPQDSWYLEKVRLKDNKWNAVFQFHSDCWLSPIEERYDTWRELAAVHPDVEPYPEISYMVEVYTGDKPGAETEANCYIHMFGTRGDSGRRPLIKSSKRTKFKRGQTDTFCVDAVSLNEIHKVELGHDGTEKGAGWYVSKVVIRECEPSDVDYIRTFTFGCDRWFDTSMEDGKIERVLIGGLELPVQEEREEEVEEEIEEESEKEEEEEEEQIPKEGVHILVKTAVDSVAPSGHKVIVTIYGREGQTEDIVLDENNNEPLPYTPRSGVNEKGPQLDENGKRKLFMPGGVDEFDIEWAKLGELYKIRIGRLEEDDDWEGWHLEEVVLVEKTDATEHVFHFDRWMARDKEDCDLFRECFEPKQKLSLIRYQISVYTGDHWAADTDADVYLHMFGSRGDAGKRLLYKSQNQFKFQRNQIDNFEMEAVDLDTIEKVVVGHNGVGHGAGWFLDKVIIKMMNNKESDQQSSENNSQNKSVNTAEQKEGEDTEKDGKEIIKTGEKPLVFYCGRWLDSEEGDGQIERELTFMEVLGENEVKPKQTSEKEPRPLTPEAARAESKTRSAPASYLVKIKTSDIEEAGTQAQVHLVFYGSDGVSKILDVGTSGPSSTDFEQGAESEHKIDIGENIGDIFKVRVTHDNTGTSPSWHLQMITLINEASGDVIKFYCDRWLSEEYNGEIGGGMIHRELPAISPEQSVPPVIPYHIKVSTGSESPAQTEAEVYLSLEGTLGNVVRWPLSSTEQLWQPGHTDEFTVEMIYLGDISKVTLEYISEEEEARWYVEKLSVKERLHALLEWVFPCNDWLYPEENGKNKKEILTTGPQIIPRNTSKKEQPAVSKNDKKSTDKSKSKQSKNKKGGKPNNDDKEKSSNNGNDWTIMINATTPPKDFTLKMIVFGTDGETEKLKLLGEEEGGNKNNGGQGKNDNKITKVEKETQGNSKSNKEKDKDKDSGKGDRKNGHTKGDDDKDEDEKESARKELEELEAIKVDFGEVGPLLRARIFYSGLKEWFLYKIKMKNDKTKQEFHFIHDNWFAAASEGSETTKDMPAVMPDVTPLQEIEYEISVKTGDQPRADTQADVYCTLVGSMGDSGRCSLDNPISEETKFRRGQLDVFKVTALDVGTINKVILGHNAQGRGLGFYCNHVTVKAENSTSEMLFPCNRWLDTGCDDRAIERELSTGSVLKIQEPDNKEQPKSSGVWKCTLSIDNSAIENSDKNGKTTEDKQKAIYGNDYQEDEIMITVYGSCGVTIPLSLGRPGSSKAEIKKEIAVEDIGRIEKVRLTDGRIGQDGNQTWSVSSLTMSDIDTGEEMIYNFKDMVGKNSQNARNELPALRAGELIQPVVTYKVTVRSFDVENTENRDGETSAKDGDKVDKSDNTKNSKSKPGNKNSKNKNNKKHKDKSKRPEDKEQEKEGKVEDKFVWLCLHGEKGDSGWHIVQVKNDSKKKNYGDAKGKNPSLKREGTYGEKDGLGKDAKEDKDYTEEDIQAATTIQAGFRGYRTRKELKEMRKWNEMNKNFTEKHGQAATKIQAGFRGHQARKNVKEMKKLQELEKHASENEEAVIKIQAGIRGYRARKMIRIMSEIPPVEEDMQNIVAVDLGPVTKVTLVNISGGPLAIKDVQMIPGEFSGRLQIFNYQSLVQNVNPRRVALDDDEGDGRNVEEEGVTLTHYHYGDLSVAAVPLDETPDLPKSSGTWTVQTCTGKDSDSSPPQNVVVVVCGRLKESEPIPLKDSKEATPFKRGQEDEFKVKINDDIGDIFKLRIGYQPKPQKADWFLEKITFEDDTTHDEFTCEVNSSVKVDENSDGWLEVPVVWPSVPLSEARLYNISVHTGEVENAGTEASAYIIVTGQNGQSAKRELKCSSTNKQMFQKSQVDKFTIEAVDLQDLKTVTIGHDEPKEGQGWFVEKVVIEEGDFVNVNDGEKEKDDHEGKKESKNDKDASKDKKDKEDSKQGARDTNQLENDPNNKKNSQPHRTFVFPCSRWLDAGEEDGKIERELEALPLEEPLKEYTWRLTIKTAELAQEAEVPAPSKAERVIVLYGDNGKSDVIPISSDDDHLCEPGYTNNFKFKTVGELGSLYKIRFGFSDDTTGKHSWALELVRLTCNETGQLYVFEAGGDATLTLDDENDGWKELRLLKMKANLPIHRYHVETYTGGQRGSGTDAKVYIEIYGERGDTGRRKLLKSSKPYLKFESGKVDCFVVEAVDLQTLTKVVIGHDGSGIDSGWFLDKVVIKESEEALKSYEFKCERWLDEGEDDGALERTLECVKIDGGEAKDGDYMVLVATADKKDCGTDAKVFITVFGEKGKTDRQPLEKEDKKEGIDIFACGSTDEFKMFIDPEKVGTIKKIRLEHDNSGLASGWFVKKVMLVDLFKDTNPELEFPVNRWLCVNEDDGDVVREIPVKSEKDALPITKYEVKVVTADENGDGTDANVHITLYGERGDSGRRMLKKSKEGQNKFEAGNIDTFSIEAVDLGPIEKVTIGHDGSGAGSAWKLEKVMVTDTLTGQEGIFPLSEVLDANEPGGAEREIKLADLNTDKK